MDNIPCSGVLATMCTVSGQEDAGPDKRGGRYVTGTEEVECPEEN